MECIYANTVCCRYNLSLAYLSQGFEFGIISLISFRVLEYLVALPINVLAEEMDHAGLWRLRIWDS
jgi:hypothetical protein